MGYTNVQNVFASGTATVSGESENIEFRADGNYRINGGAPINPAEQSYTTCSGSTINANESALSQVAPILSNSGDAAVILGTALVLTGVGAPIGAAMITYGGYTSIAGTVMDLANDSNNGKLTVEKAVTKGAMQLIPLGGKGIFKSLGSPAANELLNVGLMGADHMLDAMRDSKTGPYTK